MEIKVFLFKLAMVLGCTIKELLSRVNSYELSEWIEFFKMYPWGPDIDRMRAAISTTVLANNGLAVINPKQYKSKKYKLEDFAYPSIKDTPNRGKIHANQTLEEHFQILSGLSNRKMSKGA